MATFEIIYSRVPNNRIMRSMILFLTAAVLFINACSRQVDDTNAKELTKQQAIEKAELFVLQNGYTGAPQSKITDELVVESLEWAENRKDLLEFRYKTLKPKSIGIKRILIGYDYGWGVAFDYADSNYTDICRVVKMNLDGSNIYVEHVDGKRSHFLGFDIK